MRGVLSLGKGNYSNQVWSGHCREQFYSTVEVPNMPEAGERKVGVVVERRNVVQKELHHQTPISLK